MFRGLPAKAAALALLSLFTLMPARAGAQSQASNGTIEGTITDASGAVLPGVTVTVTNIDTGHAQTVVTNENGLFRAPLLPLGTYKVVAELQGFKQVGEDRHHALGRRDRRRQRGDERRAGQRDRQRLG